MATRHYKIIFTTGEKFFTSCYDDYTPEQSVADWQNPSLPPANILSVTELLTNEDIANAKQEIFNTL